MVRETADRQSLSGDKDRETVTDWRERERAERQSLSGDKDRETIAT